MPKSTRKSKAVDYNKLSLRQTVAQIREHLEKAGFDPVLTGKACAGVYMGAQQKPKAIEFVVKEYNVNELDDAMKKIGFKLTSMNTYENKRSPFDIVFLPPPLTVGDDLVDDVVMVRARPGKVKLLNPTDCVRQRLSVYYRWGDADALAEAVQVAKRNDIDMELVKRWSEWEWASDRYEEFVKALKSDQ
ncbi:MAG: hypothetical protein ABH871_06195 [Pseudomonadota bacterium]